MSFILDALRKSEAERRRQTGPTLHELRAAPQRSPLPTWVALVLVALLLNLLGMGYLLLRKAPRAEPAPVAASAVSAPAPLAATPAAAPRPEEQTTPVSAPAEIAPPEESPPRRATIDNSGPLRPQAQKPSRDEGPLVTAGELASRGVSLPELQLSLHAYDVEASRRYVLLNGQRLREGDSTQDGVKIERITEEGVAVAWQGRHFMVPRAE